ncbi:IclR family transcriptional regulator [Gordonia desulfuricans]|uniref:IclR family transcriptional regulator n=1 Tax=Gordonia desulfuricans TaxID=89051 RepID=A0A7K3LN05_9ACTN|nr:IclR family transcriptional regulator [Gordonia desulfuricans]NDK89635.1 IclR family transcriptional regulator [Gordonia desulfuricans]
MAGDSALVQKTVAVVRVVAAHPGGIGLSSVARETGISKATCFRVLSTLENEGWLESDSETKRYRLSLAMTFMTTGLVNEESVTRFTLDLLREIATLTRETAGIDQLSGASVIVIAEAQGPHFIGHAARRVPRSLSGWRTSTGRVMLAFSDPEVVREDFERESRTPPVSRFRTFDDFRAELAGIRERGYAVSRSELEDELSAVAVPVHVGGEVPYALWASGPAYRLGDAELEKAAEVLRDAADRLSRVLDGSNGTVPVGRATGYPHLPAR